MDNSHQSQMDSKVNSWFLKELFFDTHQGQFWHKGLITILSEGTLF